MTDHTQSLTEKSYDEIPYPVLAHLHSHPENMATIAKLHGIDAVPVDHARILELGCASGGNLIPLAYVLPESEFIGIDLSENQIKEGQEFINKAALTNIRLIAADLMNLTEDLGKFDYIIAHGLFSWVPEPVREKTLEIINELLNLNGLVFISYNVLPGWTTQEKVRDMLHFAVKDLEDPQKKVQEGLGFLDILAQKSKYSGGTPSYQPYLEQTIKEISKYSNAANFNYWYHEYFEEFNKPFYFSDFIARCEKADLQYLADAEFRQIQDENTIMNLFSETGVLVVDEVEKQQYLDFIRVRKFRQTILCRKGIKIHRDDIRSRIKDMYVTSTFVSENGSKEISKNEEAIFASLDGKERINVSDPICVLSLKKLANEYPFEMPIKKLLEYVQNEEKKAGNEISLDEIFERISPLLLSGYYLSKTINFNTWVPKRTKSITVSPEASLIARLQSYQNQKVVNLLHDTVNLDDFSKFILHFLDGETPIDTIQQRIFDLWVTKKIKIQKLNGLENSGNKTAKRFIQEEVFLILDKFLKANLLVN